MKIEHLAEPKLLFGEDSHICPRYGISEYGVFDKHQSSRRSEVNLGCVGTSQCLELFERWIEKCGEPINGPADSNQPNLTANFCGFNKASGFYSEFRYSNELSRSLKNSEIVEILGITNRRERVEAAINAYYENVKFLAQNRHVDVIICVIPDDLYSGIATEQRTSEDQLEEDDDRREEMNFRRALKARSMHLGKPLQLIRAHTLDESKGGQQDEATKAWNFCTALYYKSGPTIPWKLAEIPSKPSSCAVGIAFYRSRDYQFLNTSLAQIFDELGNGLILRGTPVELKKDDRIPRLSSEQSYDLLSAALKEYRVALGTYPARVVIHKSSNYTEQEIDGLASAARNMNIDTVDFVNVMDSKLRLFREGNYPPLRGTLLTLSSEQQVLYSRGSVWYYRTYPGLYIPQPIELRIVKSEESQRFIASEVLGLTKMNWNSTQFDGKYPVTLGCARKVGEIMKYLPEEEIPQIRYGYYM